MVGMPSWFSSAVVWVGLGSAVGGVMRYVVSVWAAGRFGEAFPWGTLLVNVGGSLLIGLVAGLSDPSSRMAVPPGARQFLMIGVMGGFTTFSSFSLQTLHLLRDREFLFAGANVLLSVTLCLLAAWLGLVLASRLTA